MTLKSHPHIPLSSSSLSSSSFVVVVVAPWTPRSPLHNLIRVETVKNQWTIQWCFQTLLKWKSKCQILKTEIVPNSGWSLVQKSSLWMSVLSSLWLKPLPKVKPWNLQTFNTTTDEFPNLGCQANDVKDAMLLSGGDGAVYLFCWVKLELFFKCMRWPFSPNLLSDMQSVFEVFCLTHCASSVPDKQITAGYGCGNVSGPNDRCQRSKWPQPAFYVKFSRCQR